MNRRFFISSSIAVSGGALLSRLPLLSQVANGSDWKNIAGRSGLGPQPGPLPVGQRVKLNMQRRGVNPNRQGEGTQTNTKGIKKVIKTDAEWKKELTPEQYNVLRQKGTEYAFTSPLNDIHDKGIFECAACGLPLFSSAQKFDSGTGWPSFWAPIKKENVIEETDKSLGMTRTEVLCAQCEGHLGHVFDDGPRPTGLRYCMNGVAMKFVKQA
jgi:peptide-methionine (R)-S-oxide reductase